MRSNQIYRQCLRSQRPHLHSVRTVNYHAYTVSAQSTTTPTQCPRSQRPCLHSVRAVNDYAYTVSAQSTNTPTQCPLSQRPRLHSVRLVNDHAYTVSAQSTTTPTHFSTCFSFSNNSGIAQDISIFIYFIKSSKFVVVEALK